MIGEVRPWSFAASNAAAAAMVIAYSLIVPVDLVAQHQVLLGGPAIVELQTTDAVQSLEVQPAAELDAHAVHDEVRSNMDLPQNNVRIY